MGNRINKSQDFILCNTDQQVNDELLARGAAMRYAPTRNPDTGAVSPPITVFGGQAITNYSLQNRSGSTAVVGIGFRLRNDQWVAGQWTDSTSLFTNDTVDAQDIGASDFALEVITVNDDGFVILSSVPFDWVSINVGTAGVDGAAATDRAVRYSNAAGSGWTAVAAASVWLNNFTATNAVWAAGENVFAWAKPSDWGKTNGLTGISNGWYAINVRSTTAPDTTAALATAIEIGTFGNVVENVLDNQSVSEEQCFLREPLADGLVAFFSVAGAGNHVKAEWVHAG